MTNDHSTAASPARLSDSLVLGPKLHASTGNARPCSWIGSPNRQWRTRVARLWEARKYLSLNGIYRRYLTSGRQSQSRTLMSAHIFRQSNALLRRFYGCLILLGRQDCRVVSIVLATRHSICRSDPLLKAPRPGDHFQQSGEKLSLFNLLSQFVQKRSLCIRVLIPDSIYRPPSRHSRFSHAAQRG